MTDPYEAFENWCKSHDFADIIECAAEDVDLKRLGRAAWLYGVAADQKPINVMKPYLTTSSEETKMSIRKYIKTLLGKYCLTQKEVARRAGMDGSLLSREINGKTGGYKLSAETIERISTAIGCTKEETDMLYWFAGRVPERIEKSFIANWQCAQLLLLIARMPAGRVRRLLKEMEK